MYQVKISNYLSIEVTPNTDETEFITIVQDHSDSQKYNPWIFFLEPEHICIFQNELSETANIIEELTGKHQGVIKRTTESLGLEIEMVFDSFYEHIGIRIEENLPIIIAYCGYGPEKKRNAIVIRLYDVKKLYEGLDGAYRSIRTVQAIRPYNEGTQAMQQQNYTQAITYLKSSILLDPHDSLSVFNLAMCYDHLGQLDDALLWYQRAMDLDTQDPDPIYNMADIYFKKGRIPEAKKLCWKALDLFEQMFENAQFMLLPPHEPLTRKQLLADISYREATALHLLSLIEVKDGRLQEALELICKATKIYPYNTQWFLLMSQIYYALGYPVQAREAHHRAMELVGMVQHKS